MTREQTVRLVPEYLDLYYSIGVDEREALLEVADIFDQRFINEFIPYLEGMLTVSRNIWQMDNATDIIVKSGRKAKELGSQIVDLVTTWTTDNFPVFYKQGLELWNINLRMLDELPHRVKLEKSEPDLIASIIRAEVSAWQDHLVRHVRQVERYVQTGMSRGWTTERFVDQMTCPDGHILGFLYGNSRLSWYEHLRRFGKARPRSMAQTALERRGNR